MTKRSLSCSKPASEPTRSPRHALRTPAHPRRSSSKTQSLMLKTGHCRPHNSFDGLSGYFKACTSALFARHPHDQTQPLMLKTGHCRPHNSLDGLSGCFKACTSALFARHPHDQTQPLMPETGQDCPRKLSECIPNEFAERASLTPAPRPSMACNRRSAPARAPYRRREGARPRSAPRRPPTARRFPAPAARSRRASAGRRVG